MKKLAATLASLAAATALQAAPFPHFYVDGGAPEWEATPDAVLNVKWHRTSGLGFTEDGVCHLVMTDDPLGLRAGQQQVLDCAEKLGKATGPAPAGTIRVHFWFARSALEIDRKNTDITRESAAASTSINGLGGFYFKRHGDEVCRVVLNTTAPTRSAGHEVKHCHDGLFHSTVSGERGAIWLKASK